MPVCAVALVGDAPVKQLLEQRFIQAGITVYREPQGKDCPVILAVSDAADYLEKHAGTLPQATVVSDTAQVKGDAVERCQAICRRFGCFFVGAHPMSEQYIFTVTAETDRQALAQIQAVVAAAGWRCVYTTPQEHDRRMAYTCQLPQLLAAAYVQLQAAATNDGFSDGRCDAAAALAQNGWDGALQENGAALCEQLDELLQCLQYVRESLQRGEAAQTAAFMQNGKRCYEKYFQK